MTVATAKNPRTPSVPPEQIAAITLASLGILGQLVPITEDAKQGIVTIATVVGPTLVVGGAAIRVGRQKWWKNFIRVDADHDPATPDTLIPVPFLVGFAVTALIAVGMTVALLVVLL